VGLLFFVQTQDFA